MPQHAEAVVIAQFLRVLFLLSTTRRCKYGIYPQMAATAYLAELHPERQPKTLTLIGGPIDPDANPSQRPTVTRMGGQFTTGSTRTILLVSPLSIFNCCTGAYLPSFVEMAIHFTPEPGALLLVGSGVAALVLHGRRRMRSRRR